MHKKTVLITSGFYVLQKLLSLVTLEYLNISLNHKSLRRVFRTIHAPHYIKARSASQIKVKFY